MNPRGSPRCQAAAPPATAAATVTHTSAAAPVMDLSSGCASLERLEAASSESGRSPKPKEGGTHTVLSNQVGLIVKPLTISHLMLVFSQHIFFKKHINAPPNTDGF